MRLFAIYRPVLREIPRKTGLFLCFHGFFRLFSFQIKQKRLHPLPSIVPRAVFDLRIQAENGTAFPWIGGKKYELYPIEYKHGSIRMEPEYEYQLCAQAMCMEEMFGCSISSGAIFFISSHRNQEVRFTKAHREAVEKTAAEL